MVCGGVCWGGGRAVGERSKVLYQRMRPTARGLFSRLALVFGHEIVEIEALQLVLPGRRHADTMLDHELSKVPPIDQDHSGRHGVCVVGGLLAEGGGRDEDALRRALTVERAEELLNLGS